jgi:hypothetical protein
MRAERLGELARGPHIVAADGQLLQRPSWGAGGDAAAARKLRPQQHRRRRPMIRILRQHAFQQVGDHGGQRPALGQGRITADLHLSPQYREVAHPRHRHPPQQQREQRDPERIDVVRDHAVTPAGGHAARHVGRLEHRWLQTGRRPGPEWPERDGCAGAGAEQIVRIDRPMGKPARRQHLQG